MSGSPAGERPDVHEKHGVNEKRSVNVTLEGFAWEAVERESTRLGISVEDFATFAVLYYLADVDSGRIARQVLRSPYPGASA